MTSTPASRPSGVSETWRTFDAPGIAISDRRHHRRCGLPDWRYGRDDASRLCDQRRATNGAVSAIRRGRGIIVRACLRIPVNMCAVAADANGRLALMTGARVSCHARCVHVRVARRAMRHDSRSQSLQGDAQRDDAGNECSHGLRHQQRYRRKVVRVDHCIVAERHLSVMRCVKFRVDAMPWISR